ncbi:DUF418 domain-containing protein [Marinactinospora rubrisoli]|uniref:DUF418 domain-containing protein n=1 Tax=Marinactinospora rubrisoli TaxID=2715399 RepID=A0ABW2KNP4_9ACTN
MSRSPDPIPAASPAGRRRRPARGGVRSDERALAPDLARGGMLLLIVLSNTVFHLWAAEYGPSGWHPVGGSALDAAVRFVMITMLDLRAYPLFAFLFGYGLMRLYQRQIAAGAAPADAVALLRRRGLWLVGFGFAHAALLMAGDIVGAYGLASLLLVPLFVRRRDRTLVVAVCVASGVVVATMLAPAVWAIAGGNLGQLGDPSGTGPTAVVYASGEPHWPAAAGTRLGTWSFVTVLGGLLSFGGHSMMLLGFLAARHGVLEEPHRYLPLLRRTALLGVATGWLGGLPAALAHAGALEVPAAAVAEEGALRLLQEATGLAGGLGYVAVFALVAQWISVRGRRGPVVRAVAAAGQRSLSCYLAHSALFAPVLAAWGLGLGGHLNSAGMAAFATGVWLVTVAGAAELDRRGLPGPAEALLRRLVYGRTMRRTTPPPALPHQNG